MAVSPKSFANSEHVQELFQQYYNIQLLDDTTQKDCLTAQDLRLGKSIYVITVNVEVPIPLREPEQHM